VAAPAPDYCCYYPCLTTGTFPQIAALIGVYSQRPSSYAMPADPMTLYQTLQSGRPILLHVRSNYASHVVLLKGMHFQPHPGGVEAYLHINDPMSYFTAPIAFSSLAQIWVDALVVN